MLLKWSFALVLLVTPAAARDTGEFADEPNAHSWFQGNQQKICCNEADAHKAQVRKNDATGLYEVLIENEWVTVPPNALKEELSPFETAVVWYWHWEGKPRVRCLMLSLGT